MSTDAGSLLGLREELEHEGGGPRELGRAVALPGAAARSTRRTRPRRRARACVARSSSASVGSRTVAQPLDDRSSSCSPRSVPSSTVVVELAARRSARSAPGTAASTRAGSAQQRRRVGARVRAATTPAHSGRNVAIVGIRMSSPVTAFARVVLTGLLVPELLERASVVRRTRSRATRARSSRRARRRSGRGSRLATASNELNARSSTSTDDPAGIRRSSNPWRCAWCTTASIRRPSSSLARSAAGAYGCRAGRCASHARQMEPQRERAATTARACGGARGIHGGVVSSPHSHGWMSVTSPLPVGFALAVQPLVVRDELREQLGEQRRAARPASACATRSVAIAGSGGWVMHEVSTSRGATAWRFDCQMRRLPTSRTSLAKIMCGQHPVRPLTAEQRAELARGARRGRTWRARSRRSTSPRATGADTAVPTGTSTLRAGCARGPPARRRACEFRRVDLTAARHRSGRYHRARAPPLRCGPRVRNL